jgi:5-methylcytosine-specific restriction endonuclease McrA
MCGSVCKGGLKPKCKKCRNQSQRSLYANNAEYAEQKRAKGREHQRIIGQTEEYREYQREWYRKKRSADPEFRRRDIERSRQYRQDNREEILEQRRRRYWEDEEYRERQLQYHRSKKYRERANARRRRRYWEDEEYRERQVEYAKQRHKELQARSPEYRKLRAVQSRKRYVAKKELPLNWSIKFEREALDYWNGCCVYCGEPIEDGQLHFDHYIPVSYDGDDNPGTVPENMLPTCQYCNLSKNASMPEEWIIRTFDEERGMGIIEAIEEYFSLFFEDEGE